MTRWLHFSIKCGKAVEEKGLLGTAERWHEKKIKIKNAEDKMTWQRKKVAK